jgi:predicted metal-dependent hydrolase
MNMENLGQQTVSVTYWQDSYELKWAARHWAARIGVRVPQIYLRPMSRKWASVSTAGRLTLDTHLLNLPKDLGEFVIVHELVHLLAPNHNKLFKSFMHAYLPDWEEREQRLMNQDAKTFGVSADPKGLTALQSKVFIEANEAILT